MVSAPAIIIFGIAIVAFLAFDGVKKTGGFIESIRKGSLPIIGGRETPLRDSSSTEIRTEINQDELLLETTTQGEIIGSSSIASRSGKRTAKPSQLTTTVKAAPKAILSAQQSGAIARVSNISGGRRITLSSKEISDLRKRPLTAQEEADVAALQSRIERKPQAQQQLKTDPRELVLQKREQELISKKVIGESSFVSGKLFANPDFPLTPAERKARGL